MCSAKIMNVNVEFREDGLHPLIISHFVIRITMRYNDTVSLLTGLLFLFFLIFIKQAPLLWVGGGISKRLFSFRVK